MNQETEGFYSTNKSKIGATRRTVCKLLVMPERKRYIRK